MRPLNTYFAGLLLKSPVIAAASPITANIERIKELATAGVGAIVLRSLFEEQIAMEASYLQSYNNYPETADYLNYHVQQHRLSSYLELIEQAKAETSVPIIASINCMNSGEWIDFAEAIEEAGADALELNIYIYTADRNSSAAHIEHQYLDIVWSVTSRINIPVIVKLGRQFTNITSVVNSIEHCGARGVVLFNRLYTPDIDIDKVETKSAPIWSDASALTESLRWIAITSAAVPQIDIAASTGIYGADDVIKSILAGASSVEVCSTLFINGVDVVRDINSGVLRWLEQHNIECIKDAIGMLNYKRVKNPLDYERVQFMKYFTDNELIEEVI